MKKITQLLLVATIVLSSSMSFAQSTASKDENRIMLTSWVPPTIEGMPRIARKNLQNKLKQVVTKNGLGGSPFNTRFIISANVSVMSKDILPGPPPMHAYNLDITLYIGDGIEGTDITEKLISRKDLVPLTVQRLGMFQVTGEIVAIKEIPNSRNYAAGSLNLKDFNEFKTRAISFYAYGVYPYQASEFVKDINKLTVIVFYFL